MTPAITPELRERAGKDRPIIFSASMVRALIEGRKTQTRRIVKRPTDHFHASYTHLHQEGERFVWSDGRGGCQRAARMPSQIGDRLWVKENWRTSVGCDSRIPSSMEVPGGGYGWPVWYDADGGAVTWRGSDDGGPGFVNPGKLRPSIFMPRWASRLTLVVEGAKIERLHDISEADAEAEGLWRGRARRHLWWVNATECRLCEPHRSHKAAFGDLWSRINGATSWDANPWVAAISFRTILANIDAPPASPLATGEAA